MTKFEVSVWFAPQQIIVSAKNSQDAKKKAYQRLAKKKALSFVERKHTEVY